ncbi:MAG: glutaminyl-peptide cyclotransferase [Bacteroidales bacterium]|nr:glutaminyl-peptide cyclotransferase [Bacteroidales bacterium]
MFRLLRISILMITVVLSFACCHKTAPKTSVRAQESEQKSIAGIISPEEEQIYTWGDSVRVVLDFLIPSEAVDSVQIIACNNSTRTFKDHYESFYWHTEGCPVGLNTVRVKIHYNDSLVESHSFSVVLFSDRIPENYSYSLIRTFPHDPEAYTQGLLYHEGLLYESTGLEGKSSLRVVNISTGKPEKVVYLRPEFFAEGIACFSNQIYQVTYRSKVGFIYNISTLELVRSFTYRINEGWGLTSDGSNLIMSDGSEHLYILEPEFFTQVGQVEVFDHNGRVSNLNEMEFINGKILANVYGETYIVIVDLKTGKVTGRLDLNNLLPEGAKGDMNKVMNGIAYNPLSGNLYITGKNWPVLYEIKVLPSL